MSSHLISVEQNVAHKGVLSPVQRPRLLCPAPHPGRWLPQPPASSRSSQCLLTSQKHLPRPGCEWHRVSVATEAMVSGRQGLAPIPAAGGRAGQSALQGASVPVRAWAQSRPLLGQGLGLR